jgi:arginyl-tRNA--protein-N-Asp/Glu arginylyltransferase
MTSQTPKPPMVFYRTGPMPCPYLGGKVERNLFTELNGAQAQGLHDQLAQAGFRRSHHIVYRPACPGCNGCVPVRIPVAAFRMSRSQRRVWNKNADLQVSLGATRATEEHYALFTRYQNARHSGGEMATMSFSDFRAMIEDSVVDTELMSIRAPSGRLIGACLTDRLSHGYSAVYSYFDPDEDSRSLGTYCVLWLLDHAQGCGLDHLYLGYWIAACAKMTYKSRFQPIEHLGTQGWQSGPLPRTNALETGA